MSSVEKGNDEAKRTGEDEEKGEERGKRGERERERERREKERDNKHVRVEDFNRAESSIIDEALLVISPRPAPSLCEPDP